MKKVLVTGGAGYVGAVLVPKLLANGHHVTVLDLFLYNSNPWKNCNYPGKFKAIQGDIRDEALLKEIMPGHDTVIHLACISNDPSFDLDPKLGLSINLMAFEPLVKIAVSSGVKRFINASSSSVYGVSEEDNITEDSECKPLTDYSIFKLQTEQILTTYRSPRFETISIRSATVCGYSPRQRLDVIVNILTKDAYHKNAITVMGGPQKRPNVHIQDITDFYIHLVERDKLGESGCYNYGSTNYTVEDLAKIVQQCFLMRSLEIFVNKKKTNDPRSYHISSERAARELGCKPKRIVADAVFDLMNAFDSGLVPKAMTDSQYYNVQKLKETNWGALRDIAESN